MSTTAWFHCFSGVAGDMALGALVDAGAPVDQVVELLDRLPVKGWALTTDQVMRGGIAGTKATVHAQETTVVRTAAHIQGLVTEARLPDRVQRRALAVFTALATAEGRLHRRPPDQVHFHEVGGIDAIVDVVGTCAALEILDVDSVTCSPVAVGLGMVRAAHGIIPNPAPAVVELLRGSPTYGVDLTLELTTPTGAALMAGLATSFGALPPMTVAATGFGAGSRELPDRPNLTQVVLGEVTRDAPVPAQPQLLVEANVDDVTGEVLAHTVSALLEAGAADAWITPVVGKKGRPAHVISALCDVALLGPVRQTLVHESGTLGVRGQVLERWPEPRHFETVELEGGPVRVKVSPGRVKAEFDDAARNARDTTRPVRDVVAEAESRWRTEGPAEPVEHRSDLGDPEHADRPDHSGRDRPDDGGDPGNGAIPLHNHDNHPVHGHGHDHDHGHGHDHDPPHPHDSEPGAGPRPPRPDDVPPA